VTPDPIVILDHVSAGYGQTVVLRDLCLELPRGSFTALLGGNGSGKTTLLKTLAGILRPLAGDLRFPTSPDGETVIGYVPQRESLDPLFLLSGFEVALMGTYGRVRPGRRVPKDEREFALQCLRLTGAEEFSQQPFSELSGGQKQRVLIARALTVRPRFLLLDEPTAGIDVPAVESIMETLTTLHREWGLTVLLVSHDLPVVQRYVERVLLIRKGSLVGGTATDMLGSDQFARLLELSLG
jgi:manganese/zinc/iron transport system ATP- binding protein